MEGRAPLPDPGRYRLVVFDLDGTLYRQGPVRRRMALELLAAGGAGGRLTRLRVLRRYRALREHYAETTPRGFGRRLFAQLAAETGRDEGWLEALVEEWMERRPLRWLAGARVEGAAELFAALRTRGARVAVWSDYPVRDKLAALGLAADHMVSACDPGLDALKPDPAGLRLAMEAAGVGPGETLMVGDRQSRDGAAAAALGVDFLLRADAPPRGGGGVHHVKDFVPLLDREPVGA